MGTNNKGGNKNLSGIAGIITAVGSVAAVVTPLVEKAIDNAGSHPKEKVNEKATEKVKVPELYHKGFPIDLEQAIKILEDCGLKASKSKLTLKEAKPQYKDCFGLQVIDSNPKQGSVVKVGSTVCLRYIPDEVVTESQRIFEETERSKIEVREKKAADKLERKERTRENVAGAVDKARQGVGKIFKRDSKVKFIKGGEALDE